MGGGVVLVQVNFRVVLEGSCKQRQASGSRQAVVGGGWVGGLEWRGGKGIEVGTGLPNSSHLPLAHPSPAVSNRAHPPHCTHQWKCFFGCELPISSPPTLCIRLSIQPAASQPPALKPTDEDVAIGCELPNVGAAGALVNHAARPARHSVEGSKVGALQGVARGRDECMLGGLGTRWKAAKWAHCEGEAGRQAARARWGPTA